MSIPSSSTVSPNYRCMTAGSTPTQGRSTVRRSFASCSKRRGSAGARDEIYRQRHKQRRCSEREQRGVAVTAAREDVGEAVSSDGLADREGGRAIAPGGGLRRRIARDQLASAADRDRDNARHKGADDKARHREGDARYRHQWQRNAERLDNKGR